MSETAAVLPDPEVVDDAMAEILRQKTPAERLAIADDLWCFARDLIRINLQRQNPEMSMAEIDRIVARRMSHEAV